MIVRLYASVALVVSVMAVREAISGHVTALLLWLFAAGLWAGTGWEFDNDR